MSFETIAKWLDKKLPMPLAFFWILKGWLYALESAWIDAKVSAALEKGYRPSQSLHRPLSWSLRITPNPQKLMA